MKVLTTALPGVVLIEPQLYRDPRGFFLETYHAARYAEVGVPPTFVQDNHSRSMRGVLRGLHAQRQRPQGKLMRVVRGEIWDVAVDIRRGSPTFGRYVGERLTAENFRQLYIPPGFAHGFVVLSEEAEVEYKCTDFYSPEDEFAILWNDPRLSIPWPVEEPTLSERDAGAPRLDEVEEILPRFEEFEA
ncbi:MAG: dTDP-4-dehydrorhamnose 3,5-epimerase [Myxococcota bacterium]